MNEFERRVHEARTTRGTERTDSAANFWELQQLVRAAIASTIREGQTSQRKLARELGISQPHISNLLSRRRVPSLLLLDQLIEAAGISIEARITKPAKARRIEPGLKLAA